MLSDPYRIELMRERSPAKEYAIAHLEGSLEVEMIWPLLKNLKIEERPSYTQNLITRSGLFKTPVTQLEQAKRRRGLVVFEEALHNRELYRRVVFDLRVPWVKALQENEAIALQFLDELKCFGMTTYLHFLTKTVMHDRSPGFKAAINTHINRMDLIEEIIVFDSDIAYIDRLYDIYEWPELKEYLSESAMAHMLERDLGL